MEARLWLSGECRGCIKAWKQAFPLSSSTLTQFHKGRLNFSFSDRMAIKETAEKRPYCKPKEKGLWQERSWFFKCFFLCSMHMKLLLRLDIIWFLTILGGCKIIISKPIYEKAQMLRTMVVFPRQHCQQRASRTLYLLTLEPVFLSLKHPPSVFQGGNDRAGEILEGRVHIHHLYHFITNK